MKKLLLLFGLVMCMSSCTIRTSTTKDSVVNSGGDTLAVDTVAYLKDSI